MKLFQYIENSVALRSHAYRAALQEIIREKDPNIEHGSIKLTLKKAHDLPFPQYVQSSFERNICSLLCKPMHMNCSHFLSYRKKLIINNR